LSAEVNPVTGWTDVPFGELENLNPKLFNVNSVVPHLKISR
jgi:hypothetical protein